MLTQEQINLLTPLMEHPRFGYLLKEAVKSWSNDITPRSKAFGIVRDRFGVYKESSEGQGCCLLGASLVKKSSLNDDYFLSIHRHFNLSEKECIHLFQGFDGIIPHHYTEPEAYQFGLAVRKIVNPKEVE